MLYISSNQIDRLCYPETQIIKDQRRSQCQLISLLCRLGEPFLPYFWKSILYFFFDLDSVALFKTTGSKISLTCTRILCRHFVFSIKICKWAGRRYRDNLCWIGVRVWCQQDYWSHPIFHASCVLQRNSKTTLLGILNL